MLSSSLQQSSDPHNDHPSIHDTQVTVTIFRVEGEGDVAQVASVDLPVGQLRRRE